MAASLSSARSSPAQLLQYNHKDKLQFVNYFRKSTEKRKRGRPRKKKRGSNAHKKKKAKYKYKATKQRMFKAKNNVIDLTSPKVADALDARLEGALTKCARTSVTRINWDKGEMFLLRKRFADSWFKGCDLYKKGESFNAFCTRMGIDRNVMLRYLKGKYIDASLATRRGRPSHLPVSVMRHLCEG